MKSVKLSTICDIQAGGTPARSNQSFWKNGNIPWVKISDFDGKYINSTSEAITQEGLAASSAKLFPKGTIVYTIFATLGEVAILNVEASTNQAIAGLILKDTSFSVGYLYYYLKSLHPYVNGIGRGVAQNNINLSILRNFEIPCKVIAEQDRITRSLETVEHIIGLLHTQFDKLDKLIKARFVEMFGDVKSFVPLKHYIKALQAGKSLAGEKECIRHVLKTGAVSYDYFDNSQVKPLPEDFQPAENTIVTQGDVIISRMNTIELVGAAAYVWDVDDNTFLPDRLWKASIHEGINPIFVWQLLIQPTTKEQIRRYASGTSGSMKNISKSALLNIPVVAIPCSEQAAFAAFVEQVDKSKVVAEMCGKSLTRRKRCAKHTTRALSFPNCPINRNYGLGTYTGKTQAN